MADHITMKYVVFIFLVIVNFLGTAQSDDFRSVNVAAVTRVDKFSLIAAGGDIVEDFEGKLAYLGVSSKIEGGPIWQLGFFGYYPKSDKGGYLYDNRLRGSLTYRFANKSCTIFHRSRWEYRMGSFAKGHRYRPAVGIVYPVTSKGIKVALFTELETFFDVRKESFKLTLLTAGIKLPLTKDMAVSISQFNIFNHEDNTYFKGPRLDVSVRL